MRIIAGEARGRKIVVPSAQGVRPTLDRVREALFSILNNTIRDNEILDLFAGSGSLGIEALSRGACHAVFVDRQRGCLKTIAENLCICGLEERATLVHGSIPGCLSKLNQAHRNTYGIIFIDPPYHSTLDLTIIEELHRLSLLKEGATIIIEHDRRREIGHLPGFFKLDGNRVYGDVAVAFLTYQE